MRYVHAGLELSVRETERLKRDEAARAIAARRLFLVLDLDHTLLNSSRFIDLTPDEQQTLEGKLGSETSSKEQDGGEDGPPSKDLFSIPLLQTWTKLRPGVRRFLEQVHANFELYVYTMGDRTYAQAMAAILDPGGRLFSTRIISAGDSTQRHVKDLDIVLGSPEQTIILDDTQPVWPRHVANVVPISRYLYFRTCAERFAPGCPSFLERATDEVFEQGPFPGILRMLSRVHDAFFEALDAGRSADVRPGIAAERRALLRGTRLLLSRVVPLDAPEPAAHPLWRLAEACGATCTLEPDQSVTHVVAPDRTQKTAWGADHGKLLVNPSWITETAGHWHRMPEKAFPIRSPNAAGGKGAGSIAMTPEQELAAACQAAGGGGTAVAAGRPV